MHMLDKVRLQNIFGIDFTIYQKGKYSRSVRIAGNSYLSIIKILVLCYCIIIPLKSDWKKERKNSKEKNVNFIKNKK